MSGGLVLGIDGGGTKTHSVIVNRDLWVNDPIAFATQASSSMVGVGGPSNIAAVTVDEALASVRKSVSAALSERAVADIVAVCAAIAGYSQVPRREEFARGLALLFPSAVIEIVPDYVAAHAGALGGEAGIIVIAGTGSVAYGENGVLTHKTGAYGYLIDDAGSGYGTGRRALAAILHASDETGPATLLTEIVAQEIGSSDWFDIITGVYGGALDRKRIASLSRCVSVAASRGDLVAVQILSEAGESLADLALTVINKVFQANDRVNVSLIGSLWNADDALRRAFGKRLIATRLDAVIIEPLHPPHVGAALLAARLTS